MSNNFVPAAMKVGYEKVLYGSDHPYNPFQMEICGPIYRMDGEGTEDDSGWELEKRLLEKH